MQLKFLCDTSILTNCPFFNAGKASAQVVPETKTILTKGEAFLLTCKVNKETISITWKKDGDPIIERALLNLNTRLDEKNRRLAVFNVVEEDSGEYSCEARNKLGTVARSVVTVNVKSKLFKQPHIILIINYVRSLL